MRIGFLIGVLVGMIFGGGEMGALSTLVLQDLTVEMRVMSAEMRSMRFEIHAMRAEQRRIGQNFDMGMRMADDVDTGVRPGKPINPPSVQHLVAGSKTALPHAKKGRLVP